ncbi:MAG: T9SS type A sorting domain-containing protein, partial [Bacteroidales bacterium]|nr:T9SS type A sorting domain-containing protein [Bacteroidales bacterium]
QETRYVRWMLASSTQGNTQLNNLVITQRQGTGGGDNGDSTGIVSPVTPDPNPYPNPAQTSFRWNLCENALTIQLFSLAGVLVRQWANVSDGETLDISGLPAGIYMLRATTPNGNITKKLIIK